jgi:predicted CxxxxCH...CXXCH cytochrome family protein
LKDGKISSTKWTQAEAVTCESCHGLPPDTGAHEEHLENGFACETCHVGYQKNTTVKKEIHIDGKRDVQLSATVGGSYSNGVCSNVICHGVGNTPPWTGDGDFTCVSCHGGLFNSTGAPPFDLKGDSTRTVKGVGAHTIHIMGSKLSDGVECTECHIRPNEIDSPGHIGVELLPAEISWGNLARMDGAAPSWDGAQTCQNVYCHGEFKYGNKNNDPIWTNFDGTQPCGSCHGVPPALSPHPQNTQCSLCHSLVVDASNNIIDKARHINGQADFVRK